MAYSYCTKIKYAVRFQSTSVWGGFVFELYSVFPELLINDEKYSVKDCKSTSSCENGILHMIKEYRILIVTWKTNYPF